MASDDNIIFVNFHYDCKTGFYQFGEKYLFRKIHDTFIKSKDYKNSNKEINEKIIEERALKLKAEAEEILISNKILGLSKII